MQHLKLMYLEIQEILLASDEYQRLIGFKSGAIEESMT